MEDQEKWQQRAEYLINRVRRNKRMLKSWIKKEAVSCYRIYDKDIPEIPLVIDIYGDYLHAAAYRTFANEEEQAYQEALLFLLHELGTALQIPPDKIILKTRKRQKGLQQYEKVSQNKVEFPVTENGLHFWINLSDYLDTGLFLDHRQTRQIVRQESEGKHVLNLFAYTGSFSVYAAAGGAASTTTVDMSQTYLDWAKRNMQSNNFVGPDHQFVRADCLHWIREMGRDSQRYDIVILDPPTFSNSKKMETILDIQQDYDLMIQHIMRGMNPEGVLYFSTNFTRFKMDKASFPNLTIEDITAQTISPDFRNQKIHFCWKITK